MGPVIEVEPAPSFPSPSRFQAVLFDVDRTLVELFTPEATVRLVEELTRLYERSLGRGAVEAVARAVVEAARAEHCRDPYRLWAGVHRALTALNEGRAEQLGRAARALVGEHECAAAARQVHALPGAGHLLAGLEADGFALAGVTRSSLAAARTSLHAAGLLSRFDVLVARTPELLGDTADGGPFPLRHALRDALAQLRLGTGAAVYVAGGVAEVRAGRAAGLATVAVAGGHPGAGAGELRAAGAAQVLEDVTALRGTLRALPSLAAPPSGAA